MGKITESKSCFYKKEHNVVILCCLEDETHINSMQVKGFQSQDFKKKSKR